MNNDLSINLLKNVIIFSIFILFLCYNTETTTDVINYVAAFCAGIISAKIYLKEKK